MPPRSLELDRQKAKAYLADRTNSSAPQLIPQVRSTVVRLSDVEPEDVRWFWPSWIPFGKLTVLEGHPGVGKSHLTIELAACISTGRALPGGTRTTPSDVVLLTAEDGLADTVRPRLDAAGGDASRVHVLTGVTYDEQPEHTPELPHDIEALRRLVEETHARLIIVDPLSAYLGGDVNSWKDTDVRRALAPLARLAEHTGAALVVLRHLTKAPSGSAITAGGGSIGIIGAARSAILAAKDPEDETVVVLAVVKANLAPRPVSLRYRLTQTPGNAAHIEWIGTSTQTADSLIAAGRDDEDRGVLGEAADWLRECLLDGPKPKADLVKLAKAQSISERTLDRAKQRLGVVHQRHGFGKDSTMLWTLPRTPYSPSSPISGEVGEYGGESGSKSLHSNASTYSPSTLASMENGVGVASMGSPPRSAPPTAYSREEEAEIVATYERLHRAPAPRSTPAGAVTEEDEVAAELALVKAEKPHFSSRTAEMEAERRVKLRRAARSAARREPNSHRGDDAA